MDGLVRSVMETKAHAILEFFARMHGTIHVAFEEGTQAQWVAYDVHGNQGRADLKELTRAYGKLVEDGTRVMLRLKALYRARAISTKRSAARLKTPGV